MELLKKEVRGGAKTPSIVAKSGEARPHGLSIPKGMKEDGEVCNTMIDLDNVV